MITSSIAAFQGSLFWGTLSASVVGLALLSRIKISRNIFKSALFVCIQLGLLKWGLSIHGKLLVFWVLVCALSYLLTTRLPASFRRSAITSFWVVLVCSFRLIPMMADAKGTAQPSFLGYGFALVLIGHWYLALRCLSFAYDFFADKIQHPSFLIFLSYLFFMPSFVAGPTDRYLRFESDLLKPHSLSWETSFQALVRILIGAFKKFVLASLLSSWLIDTSTIAAIQHIGTAALWRQVYIYSTYILVDFSAYTDLAIGTGYLFNIKLPENFNYPYVRRNIIEFWNCWHISLSSWLRDYVFLPFGQKLMRKDFFQHQPLLVAAVAYLITMIICGAWHGLSGHFLLWGLYNGLGLAVCKAVQKIVRTNGPRLHELWAGTVTGRVVSILITFHFVSIGWIFFACKTGPSFYFLYGLIGGHHG